MQLLVVQRADGTLTIGDTHRYEEPFDFAFAEEVADELVETGPEDLDHPGASRRPALVWGLLEVHRRPALLPSRGRARECGW